jgi:predicted nucleic acid-binding Zn finger protein
MKDLKRFTETILEYFYHTQREILSADQKHHNKVKSNVEKVRACTIRSALCHRFNDRGVTKLWAFVSSPNKDTEYAVRILSSNVAYCDCSDFIYRHYEAGTFCKHITAVALSLSENEVVVEPLRL